MVIRVERKPRPGRVSEIERREDSVAYVMLKKFRTWILLCARASVMISTCISLFAFIIALEG